MDRKLINGYKSIPQQTRVITENWFLNEAYCPSCGNCVSHYAANKPVADFYCEKCCEDFELKSNKNKQSNRIVDGAYLTMMERLRSDTNPNLFLMTYKNNFVENLVLIPKYFFVTDIIEKRKPLSNQARRAGWTGCNILLDGIPNSGKIYYVKNRIINNKTDVLNIYHKTAFLKNEKRASKGWIVDIMRCVEKTGKKNFVLDDIYKFEKQLSELHPDNRNIKPKIRQQIQILRDRKYLSFEGKGRYVLE
jgi:type II restriction enzyme